MYYTAKLIPRKSLFQKAFTIKENYIYITDTKHAKRKFLKSGIKNVIFTEEFKCDKIAGGYLVPIKGYNREIWLRCLEDMVYDIASFFRLSFPLGEIAVFSEKGEDIVPYLLPFGKIVTITGIDGKSEIIDGVTVRRIKKLKSPPDLIVREGERRFSPIFRVPEIYFGSGDGKKHILSCDTISCKTNLFTFEADLESVMYFVNKGEEITFEISSFRKKSPSLFTFG